MCMAPAASCTVWRLPMGNGPGRAIRSTAPVVVVNNVTARPSMTTRQSPGFSGRLTLTTSCGWGETSGRGVDSIEAPSSSIASTLAAGMGARAVATRPPMSSTPVISAPVPRTRGRRMPARVWPGDGDHRKRSTWHQLSPSR